MVQCVIKIRSQNPAYGRVVGNASRRTGIRLVARTIAGAHIMEAAAPMKMLLREILWRSVDLSVSAAIGPSLHKEGWRRSATFAVQERPHPTFVETTSPQFGRLVKAPALVAMHY